MSLNFRPFDAQWLRDRSAARGPLVAITNLAETSATIPCHCGNFAERAVRQSALADRHRLCGVKLTGVSLGTKFALRESGQHSAHGSVIVNLASVAGLVGSSNDPLYSMTKGGVTLFTKSAALEFARKGYRIRVNSIHRGTIDTDRSDQVLAMRARNLGTNDLEPAPQADAEPASRSAAWGR